MKKIISIALILVVLLNIGLVFADQTKESSNTSNSVFPEGYLSINGKAYEAIPTCLSGQGNRLFSAIDLFNVLEAATFQWYMETNLFYARTVFESLAVQEGDAFILLGTKKVTLDEEMSIIGGKPYLPLGVLSYLEGYDFKWHSNHEGVELAIAADKYSLHDALESKYKGVPDYIWTSPYNQYADNDGKAEDHLSTARALTIAVKLYSLACGDNYEFERGTRAWYDNVVRYALDKGLISENEYGDWERPISVAEALHLFKKSLPETYFDPLYTLDEIPQINLSTKYREDIVALYQAGVLTADSQYYESDEPASINQIMGILDRMISRETIVDQRPNPDYYEFWLTGCSTVPYYDRVSQTAKKLNINLPDRSTSYTQYFEVLKDMRMLDRLESIIQPFDYSDRGRFADHALASTDILYDAMTYLENHEKLDRDRWLEVDGKLKRYVSEFSLAASEYPLETYDFSPQAFDTIPQRIRRYDFSRIENFKKMYGYYEAGLGSPDNYSEGIFTLYNNHTYAVDNQIEYDYLMALIEEKVNSPEAQAMKDYKAFPYFQNLSAYVDGTASADIVEWVENRIPKASIQFYIDHRQNYGDFFQIMSIVYLFDLASKEVAKDLYQNESTSCTQAFTPLLFINGDRETRTSRSVRVGKCLNGRQQLISAIWDYFGYETRVSKTRYGHEALVTIGDHQYVMDIFPEGIYTPEYHQSPN